MVGKANQIDKFRNIARQLETDNDKSRFNERLGKIVKPAKADKEKPAD